MRDSFRETRPQRSALREAQHHLREAVAIEPYDPQAVQAGFEAVQAASSSLQQAMHTQMLATLASLGPEERRRVFQALAEPGYGHPRRPPPGPGPDGLPRQP